MRSLRINTRFCLLATLVVAIGLGSLVMAQDDAPRKKGKPLTEDSLVDFLEGLGYSVKATKNSNGSTTANLTFEVGTWTLYPTVSLSPDKSIVWITVGLVKLEKGIPDDIIVKIFAENEKDLKFFSMNPSTRLLKINLPLPNYDNLTPAYFREQMDFLKRRIGQTEDLWNPKKWSGGGSGGGKDGD